ncbi:MAG: hypothetical protein PVH25_05335 [Burkholderiales bacterium]|jgi:hypothetical protein
MIRGWLLCPLLALLLGASAAHTEPNAQDERAATDKPLAGQPAHEAGAATAPKTEAGGVPEEVAEKAKLQADEDPLARQQAEQQIEQEQAEETGEAVVEPGAAFSLDPYASVRLRYRYLAGGEEIWGDGGSRVGVKGR